MNRRVAAAAACWWLGIASGCEGGGPAEAVVALPEPAGPIALRVEGERVTATSVALVAAAQSLPPKEAAERALFDAVLAAHARRVLDGQRLEVLADTVLARALLVESWRELVRQPITDAELAEATEAFWVLYARPEGRRTAHAHVGVQPTDSPEVKAKARALAARVRAAVEPAVATARDQPPPTLPEEGAFETGAFARDPLFAAFRAAAQTVTADGVTILVQEVPSITRDNHQILRGWESTGPGFDLPYTEAAWNLSERGALSEVIETKFGFHVIVLLEVTPANLLDRAARAEALRERILTVRGKRFRRELLSRLEKETVPQLAANHEALLGMLDLGADPLAKEEGPTSP